jgi:hypothetical protein
MVYQHCSRSGINIYTGNYVAEEQGGGWLLCIELPVAAALRELLDLLNCLSDWNNQCGCVDCNTLWI